MSGIALGRIWIAAAAVAAGAVAGQTVAPNRGALVVVSGLPLLLLRRRPAAVIAGLTLVGTGTGIACAAVRAVDTSALVELAESVPRCEVTGRVAEQLGGLGTLVAVDRANCDGTVVDHPGTVVLDAPDASPGAGFIATGWMVPLRHDRFDTQRRRLGAHARFAAQKFELGPIDAPVPAVVARIRGGLRDATSILEARPAGLLRGLTIGDVTAIDEPTEESMRRAGLAHLVAVSGSNVAIVLGAVGIMCRRLSLRVRVCLAASALFAFVAVVGPEPSVLRAAFMGAVGLAAITSGHRAEPLHALGIAVIVVLCIRPAMVFSIGLHLSVAATAGIVLLTGPIRRRLTPIPDILALPLAATLGAQVAVAPILVSGFGELSLVAPVTNLLVVPAVPAGTILGLLAGVVGTLVPPLGAALARLAAPAADWILAVADRFGGAGWASVTVPRWSAALLAFALVAAAATFLRRRFGPATG